MLNTNKFFMLISGWTCTKYASASLILIWIIIQKHFEVFFRFFPLLTLHAFTDHLFIQPTMTRSPFCFITIHFIFILFWYLLSVLCFWLCRQTWLILFLVCLTPNNGILRYLYKLDNIWMPCRGYFLIFLSFSCYGINQESEIEQASLCIMDGAPWWREAGTCFQFTYLTNLILYIRIEFY